MWPLASAGKVTGNSGATKSSTAICLSQNKLLTLASSGTVGTIQWQKYNAGASATTVYNTTNVNWTDISQATSATYTATSASVGNVWFRAKLTNSTCTASAYSAPVNIWFKSCSLSSKTTISNDTMNQKPQEQKVVATPFDVVVYPNPSTSTFTLNVTSNDDAKVEIRVYDSTGRLVEANQYDAKSINQQEIGANYSSGIYNLILTQGLNVKTLRVIKK